MGAVMCVVGGESTRHIKLGRGRALTGELGWLYCRGLRRDASGCSPLLPPVLQTETLVHALTSHLKPRGGDGAGDKGGSSCRIRAGSSAQEPGPFL